MTSAPKLDKAAALKMSRALEPMLVDLSGYVAQVGQLPISYPAGVELVTLDELPDGPAPDTVLVFQLGLGRADGPALRALARRMKVGARLHFVEPVCGVGVGRTVQRTMAPLFRRKHGWDFESDAPAIIRGSGFDVLAVERFVYGPSPMVFTFAAGMARVSSR